MTPSKRGYEVNASMKAKPGYIWIITQLGQVEQVKEDSDYNGCPARCGKCGNLALELDPFFPFHSDHNRCKEHAPS